MSDWSDFFEGKEVGACDAVHKVLYDFWETYPQLVPVDQGAREVFDLELRKNLAEFNWFKLKKNGAPSFNSMIAYAIAFMVFGAGFYRRGENQLTSKHKAIYAIHGEWSTRTMHMWRHLSGHNANVILLGRPVGQLNIKSFQTQLVSHGIDAKELNLIRPFSLQVFKKTISNSAAEARQFLIMLRVFTHLIGYAPNTQQVAKMLYRLLLGLNYKYWITEQKFTATMCIFGHSGLADSGRLDHALREQEITTKHWFHGASHGQNFFGYSSVAICQSKHDKELTSRLGGYERAVYVPQSMPMQAEENGKWLLMTNWLHPQNRSFKRFGARDELMLLDQVACAAEKLNFPLKKIVWKPHPVFYNLPSTIQKQVLNRVAFHGFQEWPKHTPFSLVSEYTVVICTASTTVIDALKFGVVPLVHVFQSFDDVLYVNALPKSLLIKNFEQMVYAIQKLSDPEFKKLCFHEAWYSLLPNANKITPENL